MRMRAMLLICKFVFVLYLICIVLTHIFLGHNESFRARLRVQLRWIRSDVSSSCGRDIQWLLQIKTVTSHGECLRENHTQVSSRGVFNFFFPVIFRATSYASQQHSFQCALKCAIEYVRNNRSAAGAKAKESDRASKNKKAKSTPTTNKS